MTYRSSCNNCMFDVNMTIRMLFYFVLFPKYLFFFFEYLTIIVKSVNLTSVGPCSFARHHKQLLLGSTSSTTGCACY